MKYVIRVKPFDVYLNIEPREWRQRDTSPNWSTKQ